MEAVEMMWRIGAAWRRVAASSLRPYGMSLAQYELTWVARRRGAINPSVAAAELGWDRPTLTVVARACLDSGWLKRSRSVRDRRQTSLELTGAGEELLDRIEAAKPFALDRIGNPFDVVSAEDRGAFLRILDRLLRRAGDLWERKGRA